MSFIYKGNDCRTGTIEVYLNGSNIGAIPQLGWFFVHTGDIALGAYKNDTYFESGSATGDGAYFEGSIGEFIVYNNALNDVQRIIIENYLSGKYNIALDSNDLYIMDNGANGNYDHEIAGVGRLNGFEEDNDSQGRTMLRIRNSTDLNNDEFLIWGHNNGEANASESVDVPAGVEARLARVWRLNEVNTTGSSIDVGNIDLQWDLNGLGSVTPSDLRLLIDNNSNGLFNDESPISGATDLGGGIYAFQNVNGGAGGLQNGVRLTIATADVSQTPLPITLIEFEAHIANESIVELNWETASEQNNDFFTIQRSSNGKEWKSIQTVDGAGNASTIKKYQTFDLSPLPGRSYYRLKQTDYDGQSSLSVPQVVQFNKKQEAYVIYPNPTSHSIKVMNVGRSAEHLRIYNTVGQDVTELTKMSSIGDQMLTIDLSGLANGVYLVKIGEESYTVLKHE